MTTEPIALGLEEDDDLFARPPRTPMRSTPKAAHIVCRVCGRPAMVAIGWAALLCPECIGDLDATRDRVASWLGGTLARLEQAKVVWEAERDASPAKEKWDRVQDAMIAVAEKRITAYQFDSTWAKRKAQGGPLAALLIAHEAYARECEQISEELAKLHDAQTEINAAFLATEI